MFKMENLQELTKIQKAKRKYHLEVNNDAAELLKSPDLTQEARLRH